MGLKIFFVGGLSQKEGTLLFISIGIFEFCNNNALYYLNSKHHSLGCCLLKCYRKAWHFFWLSKHERIIFRSLFLCFSHFLLRWCCRKCSRGFHKIEKVGWPYQGLHTEEVGQMFCTLMVGNLKITLLNTENCLYNQGSKALIREVKKKQVLDYLTEKCMFCVTWVDDVGH